MYIECYMHENGIKIVAALPKLRYLHFFLKLRPEFQASKKQLQVLALFSTFSTNVSLKC